MGRTTEKQQIRSDCKNRRRKEWRRRKTNKGRKSEEGRRRRMGRKRKNNAVMNAINVHFDNLIKPIWSRYWIYLWIHSKKDVGFELFSSPPRLDKSILVCLSVCLLVDRSGGRWFCQYIKMHWNLIFAGVLCKQSHETVGLAVYECCKINLKNRPNFQRKGDPLQKLQRH